MHTQTYGPQAPRGGRHVALRAGPARGFASSTISNYNSICMYN